MFNIITAVFGEGEVEEVGDGDDDSVEVDEKAWLVTEVCWIDLVVTNVVGVMGVDVDDEWYPLVEQREEEEGL